MTDINQIYNKYFDTCTSIAYKMTKDEALSKDIAQLSLIKVWGSLDSYDPSKAKFFTWLYSIVKRECINQIRFEKVRNFKGSYNEEMFDNLATTPSINPDTIDFYEQLNKVSLKYRFCLVKSYIEGYTQEEISKNHDIPLGSVKSHIKSGLKELKLIYDV